MPRGIGRALFGSLDALFVNVGVAEFQPFTELHQFGDAVTPMKRHGTPAEVARAAIFLAFDATFTTEPNSKSTAASQASTRRRPELSWTGPDDRGRCDA